MNHRAKKSNLPFYVLVDLLYDQAEATRMETEQVRRGQLNARCRPTYRDMQKKLFRLWTKYNKGKCSTNSFVEECARMVNPITTH